MNASSAKQVAYDSVENQLKGIFENIHNACKKGLLEIHVYELAPACQSLLEDRGYEVTYQTFSGYSIYNISWKNAKD